MAVWQYLRYDISVVLQSFLNQPTMSTVEYMRQFVNERLSAAAEEIFRVFEKTIFEYEEEIDRQRRLLDVVWKPEIKLHRIELPQRHVSEEEELLFDQQLCIQERSSSLDPEDPEDPEPPQIKAEQGELCVIQEGEQLELKQETETFVLTPTDEESDHQLFSYISHVAESPDRKGSEREDSGSIRNAEQNPKNQHQQSRNGVSKVHNSEMSIDYNSRTGQKTVQCAMCNKTFQFKSRMLKHLKVHTVERPHSFKSLTCDTCGKAFIYQSSLLMHLRTHSGEKPYCCDICGKRFSQKSSLKSHTRIHTGEKPYSCKTCGKGFSQPSALNTHITIHTGEKPYSCKTCGKVFRLCRDLTVHTRIHTGEKPCTCLLCGKTFRVSSDRSVHMRRHHKGLKP